MYLKTQTSVGVSPLVVFLWKLVASRPLFVVTHNLTICCLLSTASFSVCMYSLSGRFLELLISCLPQHINGEMWPMYRFQITRHAIITESTANATCITIHLLSLLGVFEYHGGSSDLCKPDDVVWLSGRIPSVILIYLSQLLLIVHASHK